jgi:hypothetical protein
VFVITASAVVETLAVLDAAAVALEQVTQIFDAQSLPPSPWPAEVLLGTVCFHLAGPKTAQRFVARRDLTPARFASLLADATSPPTAPDESGEAIRETRLQV